MTVATEITHYTDLLSLLRQAQKDIVESGAVQRIEKGSFSATFYKREEIATEIRETKSKLIILERGIY